MRLSGRCAALFLLASVSFALLTPFIPAAAIPCAAIGYALIAGLIIRSQKRKNHS